MTLNGTWFILFPHSQPSAYGSGNAHISSGKLCTGIAALKCDIMGKEDNYKYMYLVALYMHQFKERFTFSVFFFLQVCFWVTYNMKLKFLFMLGYFI